MSYGNELLADYAYEREQSIEKAERLYIQAMANASHGLWKTKDGEYIPIREMETAHIHNCIRMLERNDSPYKEPYIKAFEKELAERRKDEID